MAKLKLINSEDKSLINHLVKPLIYRGFGILRFLLVKEKYTSL